ncbi:MAG: hypothetical protein IJE78_10605 [Bacteroidaceae bacterium]|nr:hypothetical protein [Bacteroidaceae bacterium]
MKRKVCMVLALFSSLVFAMNLMADGGKKQPKYANSKFVWTDNYVIEGANAAMAPSAEEIVTTCLSKDGKPLRWVRKNDIHKYGKYSGATTFETALYNMAVDEMINNFEKDGTLRTGLYWGGVWTRDVSYSSLLSLAYMCPDKVKNSLEVKVDRMGRIIQDTGTGGSWPCSSDRVVWALSAWNIYLATGDMEWLQKAYPIIVRSLESDFMVVYNPQTGLYRGESSFIDWREQSYPTWAQPADIYLSECLGTNAAYYGVLKVAENMAAVLGNKKDIKKYAQKAEALKKAINEHFWMEEEGYYASYFYGRQHLTRTQHSETLGESFCVLFGIADEERAAKVISSMPVGEFGPPIFSPQIVSQGNYHNNGVWPYVTSFWGKAAAAAENETALMHALACNVRTASLYATNYENYTFQTGNPYTTLMNSPNMLWGLSGFMGLFHRTFFGFEFTKEGLALKPFVPTILTGTRKLEAFPYRNMLLDITVSGSGNEIASCLVDGKEAEAFIPADWNGKHSIEIVMKGEHKPSSINMVGYIGMPETPVVKIESGKLQWAAIEGASKYQVLKDGQNIGETSSCTFDVQGDGEYQVMAIDAKGICSFASEPYRNFADALMQQLDVDKWLDKTMGEQVKMTVNIPTTGWYILDWEYANGNGEVEQRNHCANRQLYVDGKNVSSMVFPQRGLDDWKNYGWSNPVKVYLKKGNHKIGLRYLTENININIDLDKAHVKSLRLTQLP